MKVYVFNTRGTDGNLYGLRLLLTPLEFTSMQRVGIIPPDAMEVIGMQDAADVTVAMFERQSSGVPLQ